MACTTLSTSISHCLAANASPLLHLHGLHHMLSPEDNIRLPLRVLLEEQDVPERS